MADLKLCLLRTNLLEITSKAQTSVSLMSLPRLDFLTDIDLSEFGHRSTIAKQCEEPAVHTGIFFSRMDSTSSLQASSIEPIAPKASKKQVGQKGLDIINETETGKKTSVTNACLSQTDNSRPEPMKITRCPHTNRKHYAKNMCANCYRRFGRDIKATKCKHKDRLAYSLGMCQACYLGDYHKRRALGLLYKRPKINKN